MGGLIEMSQNELDRFHVLNKVLSKELTQKQAANLLSIKERQIVRTQKIMANRQ